MVNRFGTLFYNFVDLHAITDYEEIDVSKYYLRHAMLSI